MPQRKSAKKRLKADQKRRLRNLALKNKIKQAKKRFLRAIKEKNIEEAKKAQSLLYKALDKAAAKKYIHKNKASRKKSQFSQKLSSLLKEKLKNQKL
ncbi:MAG: 30S ribosomal protein S20 [Candidatus Omnitrophica bacterium]|nr:30S ribosomal protein S20 [Candidatus Omnitrophota bacterium]